MKEKAGIAENEESILGDIKWAAKKVGVSAQTMYGLVRTGRYPFLRLGGLIRFVKKDFEEFLNSEHRRTGGGGLKEKCSALIHKKSRTRRAGAN